MTEEGNGNGHDASLKRDYLWVDINYQNRREDNSVRHREGENKKKRHSLLITKMPKYPN